MSNRSRSSLPSSPAALPHAGYAGDATLQPMIGVLLRLPHEVVLARIQAALDAAGFDISPSELGVFLYPGPEGRRPSDLARQCNMTRQSMNYALAGLEQRGYLQRQDAAEGGGREVRLTERGRQAIVPIRDAVAALEREWTAELGAARFEALRETLATLSRHLGKLG